MNIMELKGFFKTKSSAEYKIYKENETYKFLFWKPNERQKKCGIKKGDLAFEGDMLSNILKGTFFTYYSLEEKEICPKLWANPTSITLTVSEDFLTIEGDLLEERLVPEKCIKDARRITRLVFKKI